MGVTDRRDSRRLAGLWIRDAVTRGMLSVDWTADQWHVPNAVLTTIPGHFGVALLTGGRPTEVDNRVTVAMNQDDLAVRVQSEQSDEYGLNGPSAIFIDFRSYGELEEASQYLGVPLRFDAFKELADRLERIRMGALTSAPMRSGTTLEHWDTRDRKFTQFTPSAVWPGGLYREAIHGQKRHLISQYGEWYETDRSTGVYLAASVGDGLIRWRSEYDGAHGGSVFVDTGVSLPDAHRRVLGLCTGLRPVVQRHSQSTRYDNVPREIAEKVSVTLNQELQVLNPLNQSRSSSV